MNIPTKAIPKVGWCSSYYPICTQMKELQGMFKPKKNRVVGHV